MTGVVVWFTGLPASGKSTLAARVRSRIADDRPCVLLDSDAIRNALGRHTYSAGDRDDFYTTLAKLAALFAHQGLVVLVAATAPRREHRDRARAIAPSFVEVHLRTSLAEVERRDPKGLYARARSGDAPMLPGVGAPYEPPEHPDVVADDGLDDNAVSAITRLIDAARPLRRS